MKHFIRTQVVRNNCASTAFMTLASSNLSLLIVDRRLMAGLVPGESIGRKGSGRERSRLYCCLLS